jgi:hypothetical protein
MADKRGLFRVNYFQNGQPATAFVVALTDVEAAAFMGVANGSGVQVTRDRYPVEVVGLDKEHAIIPSPPVNFAPPQPARQLSDSELAKLRVLLAKA